LESHQQEERPGCTQISNFFLLTTCQRPRNRYGLQPDLSNKIGPSLYVT